MSLTMSVVSGLIASVAVFGLGFLLQNAIIPWVQRVLSGQIDVTGQWHCQFTTPSGNPHQLVMTITQRMGHLNIRISAAKSLAAIGTTESKFYRGKGELRDSHLTITTRNADHHAIGIYILLLQVTSGGKMLEGCGAWRSVSSNKIQAMDFRWTKIADQVVA